MECRRGSPPRRRSSSATRPLETTSPPGWRPDPADEEPDSAGDFPAHCLRRLHAARRRASDPARWKARGGPSVRRPRRASSAGEDYLSASVPSDRRHVVHHYHHVHIHDHRSADPVTVMETSIASRLPFVDPVAGVAGRYTGQVNGRNQPHGYGALVYKDGTVKTAVWKNGCPVRFWAPDERDRKTQPLPSPSPLTNSTHLPELTLGDTGTSDNMVIETSKYLTLEKVKSLRTHDFAFVQRSDGRWTYAIVAERQIDFILFVVDAKGNTKKLKRECWASAVRTTRGLDDAGPDRDGVGKRSTKKNRKKKHAVRG